MWWPPNFHSMNRPQKVKKKESVMNRILGRVLGAGKAKGFSLGVKRGHRSAPTHIQAQYIATAKAKRFRRSQSPFASTYARTLLGGDSHAKVQG